MRAFHSIVGYVIAGLLILWCDFTMAQETDGDSCGGRETSIAASVSDLRGASAVRAEQLRQLRALIVEAPRRCFDASYDLPGCLVFDEAVSHGDEIVAAALSSNGAHLPEEVRERLVHEEAYVRGEATRIIAHDVCRGLSATHDLAEFCLALVKTESGASDPATFYASMPQAARASAAPRGARRIARSIVSMAALTLKRPSDCTQNDLGWCLEEMARNAWGQQCSQANLYLNRFGVWETRQVDPSIDADVRAARDRVQAREQELAKLRRGAVADRRPGAAPRATGAGGRKRLTKAEQAALDDAEDKLRDARHVLSLSEETLSVCVDVAAAALDRVAIATIVTHDRRISTNLTPGKIARVSLQFDYQASPLFHVELRAEPRGAALRALAYKEKAIAPEEDSETIADEAAKLQQARMRAILNGPTAEILKKLAKGLKEHRELQATLKEANDGLIDREVGSNASPKIVSSINQIQGLVQRAIEAHVPSPSDARVAVSRVVPDNLVSPFTVGQGLRLLQSEREFPDRLIAEADRVTGASVAEKLEAKVRKTQDRLCRLASAPALLSAHDIVLNNSNIVTFDYDRGWRPGTFSHSITDKRPVFVVLRNVPLLSKVRVELNDQGITQAPIPLLGTTKPDSVSNAAQAVSASSTDVDSDGAFTGTAYYPGDRAVALGYLEGGKGYRVTVCESPGSACKAADSSGTIRLIADYDLEVSGQRYLGARMGMGASWGYALADARRAGSA